MDTLFIVASVAVIILATVFFVVLWFVIGILRDIKGISRNVREEATGIRADIDAIRDDVREKGILYGAARRFWKGKGRTSTTKKKHGTNET